jgi:Na+/H+ antiporter NhaD/arsenite permease-like protein
MNTLAPPPSDAASFGKMAHGFLAVIHGALLLYCLLLGSSADRPAAFRRAAAALSAIFVLEACAHSLSPMPHLSVGVMIFVSVVFTIGPIEDEERPLGLHMGTVPPACVLWLGATQIMSHTDLVRALYGSDTLRPYHLIVMFLGSVYLCTALERSGFLHTAALKVVEKYGRSPWGLFWALGCFSATLTVLIPDDIVTMTLTPITIRMCQLLTLPEIPYLFSQFFAGNIWAVTLVTGNPTNVLLAEDLKDTFVSFAGRMGIPGIAAGLTSFVLMWITNRAVVNKAIGEQSESQELRGLQGPASDSSSDDVGIGSPLGGDEVGLTRKKSEEREFTRHGLFCLVRVLTATLICALESVHGLPVYLVVLIMGIVSFVMDTCVSVEGSIDVLRHMPWELFSFVTGCVFGRLHWHTHALSLSLHHPPPPHFSPSRSRTPCSHACLYTASSSSPRRWPSPASPYGSPPSSSP